MISSQQLETKRSFRILDARRFGAEPLMEAIAAEHTRRGSLELPAAEVGNPLQLGDFWTM